jgi:beta-lactamase superfamily II metal-dependent hydrolase
MKKILFLFIPFILISSWGMGQANGKLQMHFIDVGQGDAALLISPKGETVLFDEGVTGYCEMPIDYLESIGLTKIDYLVTSHYHDDHIGCTGKILARFPLTKVAYDRGGSNPSTVYQRYLNAIDGKRQTGVPGTHFSLDSGTQQEVTIEFVASNGAGINTDNENDLSLVALISFGKLDILMGGDLSGFNIGNYEDIESPVAKSIPQVEVYKVHHHCSQYSTNTVWLDSIRPMVGIISVSGEFGRKHGHPTAECLERLHKAGVKTYWTEEGDGETPDPMWDIVGGNIIVQADPGSSKFTVTYQGSKVDTFNDWSCNDNLPPPDPALKYSWSKNSPVYHYMDCSSVKRILPENLETGSTPPQDKRLHEGCPK